MGLFGGKKVKAVVGLDMGSSSVKVAELKKTKTGYTLAGAGVEALSPDTVADGAIMDAPAIATAIGNIFTAQKIKNKNVAIAVSGHSVIIKKITLDNLPADQLYDAVHANAGQYIPFDLDDVKLDYQELELSPDGAQVDVLLVAVKNDKINSYISVLPMAKCVAGLVDVDAFALQNCFEANYDIDPGQTIALLNIGASVMNINIVRGGFPLFTRDISVGGNHYTDTLMKELELSAEDAERLKRGEDIGVGDEQKLPVLRTASEVLVVEIQKTFDFFRNSPGAANIDYIYTAGGSCRVPGLLELIREELHVGAEEIDPFRRIEWDKKKLEEQFVQENAPRLAVSIGLALRSFD